MTKSIVKNVVRSVSGACIAICIATAGASALTLNFDNTTSATSNPEYTGASGTLDMAFTDAVSGGVNIALTVSNTTGNTTFGDGATTSKLTGFGLDLFSTTTVTGLLAPVSGFLTTLLAGANFQPFGTLDLAWADNGNFNGGNANGALPEGTSDVTRSISVVDTVYTSAATLEAAMAAAFGAGNLQAGMRFQQVNAGAGSDKLNYTGASPQPSPVPLPAAGWLLIAGLGGLAAMRRRTV